MELIQRERQRLTEDSQAEPFPLSVEVSGDRAGTGRAQLILCGSRQQGKQTQTVPFPKGLHHNEEKWHCFVIDHSHLPLESLQKESPVHVGVCAPTWASQGSFPLLRTLHPGSFAHGV